MVNYPEILLWGFVATLFLTMIMSAAEGLGLSRMSLPYMLGTVFTPDHDRAMVLGFAAHFLSGWVFAVFYGLVFENLCRAGWFLGAAIGLVQALAVLIVLMPLLPSLHPRMASEYQGPEPTRALEPPGFLSLNYGRQTPLVTVLAHLVYGGFIGAFYHPGCG